MRGKQPREAPSHPSARLPGRSGVGRRPARGHVGDRAGKPRAESPLAGASKALGALILFDPLIPVLGMQPRETTRKTENAFHPALFMIVKYWGKPARPAPERRLGKLWFVRLMEYYVAIQNI